MKKSISKLMVIILLNTFILVACGDKKITIEDKLDSDLPIIIIDTKGKSVNETDKITGVMKIFEGGIDVYNHTEYNFISQIGIKIRGNTTRKMPKKQYSIELQDLNGNEQDESILGMAKDSDWVLNAPFEDKSLIRNYVAYTIAGEIMTYAPKSRFCEVYLIDDGSNEIKDEHFMGLYLMIEKIKRGEEKVDIFPTQDDQGETSFIVAKDKQKDEDIIIPTYGNEIYLYDHNIIAVYPKREITNDQINYIGKTISEFERVLYSDKYDIPSEGYNEYIEVDSFVDYYLINEFFNNTDAGYVSTYIYKDYGEKIHAGPVWDFNASLGNSNILNEYYDYTGFYMHNTTWFERLMGDKKFVSKVIKRYKELRKTYFSEEFLLNLIDETVESLDEAPQRNFNVWPFYICNQPEMFRNPYNDFQPYEHDIKLLEDYLQANPHLLYPTDGKASSYEEEIELLKEFIINRIKWMDENIDSLYKWTD
ncbi:CotH kinase family protein [Vallitalea okinawensis]|uniref:CotH kinase family protein n=1 Tax=Vallitalea okinawensis TaxID=2078660 RepID=UPI000CFD7EE3|nr:CotH kinase family protein [Vallitalea okinawensis]